MRPPLQPEVLYTPADASTLDFASTEALPDFDPAQLHLRAIEAMQLGMDIKHSGYNLFVLGETGSGRHAITAQLLEG